MKKKHRTFALVCLISFTTSVRLCSQQTASPLQEQKAEDQAELTGIEDPDESTSNIYQEEWMRHPLDLNNADESLLASTGLFDPPSIIRLMVHIEKSGQLIDLYELQSIWDTAFIRRILPYVRLGHQSNSTLKLLKGGTHECLVRSQQIIEMQEGFKPIDSVSAFQDPNSRYAGSPQKLLIRYQFRSAERLQAGILAEKDPGELFFKKNLRLPIFNHHPLYPYRLNDGFDHMSAYIAMQSLNKKFKYYLGDFQAAYGQGLLLRNRFGFGKSSESIEIRQSGEGIFPHRSADEIRFFRGGGLLFTSGSFSTSLFFSLRKRDAGLFRSDSTGEILATSLQTSGLHSTLSEIKSRKVLGEQVLGSRIEWNRRKFKTGFTAMKTHYEFPFLPDMEPYQHFNFSGNKVLGFSADYSWVVRNMNWFGEVARSEFYPYGSGEAQTGWALMNGCMISLDQKVSVSASVRHFQPSYYSPYANAFSENTMPSNETGIYLGLMLKHRAWILNTYFDQFRFDWLKYQTTAPSEGYDLMIKLELSPSSRFNTFLRYRTRQKMKDPISESLTEEEHIAYPSLYHQENLRWNLSYRPDAYWSWRTRIEWIRIGYAESPEYGFLIAQDLGWKPFHRNTGRWKSRIHLNFRYAFFETESYTSRIYIYEQDLYGSASIPSYYYKGIRTAGLIYFKIGRRSELGLKYARTRYYDRAIISEGTLNEIQGPVKSEIRIQWRWTSG